MHTLFLEKNNHTVQAVTQRATQLSMAPYTVYHRVLIKQYHSPLPSTTKVLLPAGFISYHVRPDSVGTTPVARQMPSKWLSHTSFPSVTPPSPLVTSIPAARPPNTRLRCSTSWLSEPMRTSVRVCVCAKELVSSGNRSLLIAYMDRDKDRHPVSFPVTHSQER